MQLAEIINSRRSIRKFKEGAVVTDEHIKLLLEAAMSAPSACGKRPWEFVVVTSREKLNKIAEVHPFADMMNTASLAIVVCGRTDIHNKISKGFLQQDCAAATQNILLQATEMGLGSCWCGLYPNMDRLQEIHGIIDYEEDNTILFNIIAIGIADESPKKRGFYEPEKVRYIR